MAIAYKATASVLLVSTAATTWNVPYPASVAANDLLVLHIVSSGAPSATPPTGWTEVYRETTVANPKGAVYIKVASGSETGNLAVTMASSTGRAQMASFTGVNTTTPLDATSTSAFLDATTDATIDLASITTVTNGAMMIYAGGANSTSVTMSDTSTGAASTELWDWGALAGTNNRAGAMYYQAQTTAGTTGAKQITLSAARAYWGVFLVLRPAGGANVHTEQITTFEDATSGPWTSSLAGAGTVAVRTADEHDGQYGISADVPAATTDKAGFVQTFATSQQMTVSGWWKVTTEGASSSSNVPFARIFSGSQRLADVYRQNVSAGANVWLRVTKAIGGSNYYFISTGVRLELNTWTYISFTWGLDGNPYVWIDGTQVLGPANKPADWFAASSIDTAYLGTHEAGNQGAWSMDTVTVSTNSVAQTINLPLASEGLFSGSGTLTASVVPNPAVTAAFSGAGTLSSTRTMTATASGSLSGSGTLSSTRTMTASASAFYNGTGTLSSTRTPGASQTAGLSGSGTLSSTSVVGANRSASLSGSGTLTGSTSTASSASADFSGSGTLDGLQTAAAMVASVPLSGSGTLSKAVVVGFTASMSSSSTGTLTTATNGMSAQAAFLGTGSGTLSAVAVPAVSKTVAFTGSGTLSSTRTPAVSITKGLSGVGDLTYSLANSYTRSASLSGSGTLSGVMTGMTLSASAAFSSVGTLTGGTVNNKSVSVNLTGSGAFAPFLTAVGFVQAAGLSGSGTLSGTSILNRTATAPLSGTGTLTAVVKPNVMADFVRVGSSILVVEMTPGMKADGQLAGVGTLVGEPDELLNYDVTAYLAEKRWSGSLGSQRWKGSL